MTPANRAKLRWRGRRKRREWMEKGEGEEGERCGVAKGEAREEEKLAGKGKKREEGGGGWGKKRRREREWCACLGAKSWASRAQASSHSRAFAVRGHHRARATFGFSTSPRCCQRRYKTASLKALANSERASNSGRSWALDFSCGILSSSYAHLFLPFSSFEKFFSFRF